MSEYLSKEEIKQWRSSLEKITLEEFAARLGKKLEEAKQTNDLVDIVMKGKTFSSITPAESNVTISKISSINEKAIKKEQQIKATIEAPKSKKPVVKAKAEVKKAQKEEIKPITISSSDAKLRQEVQIVFNKALTDREQMVFDYFVDHKNTVVYAKDLAQLLGLPRDYIYKYIKNLRAKINGDNLKNADTGGFLLTV